MLIAVKRNILLLTLPALLCILPPVAAYASASAMRTVESTSAVHKPAPGSQIDWKQPLARGLVSAVPLNEGSGTTFYDAVTRLSYPARILPGTPAGAQPPTWINPSTSSDYPWIGPAISNNNATAQAIQCTITDSQFIQNVTTGYSYAVLFQPLDNTTTGRIMDGTGPAVVTIYQMNFPKRPRKVSTTWRNAANIAINPLYEYTLNTWILVLFTVQDGLGIMYVNGVEVARDTHVDLVNSWAGQTGQLVYNTTGNGSMMCNANFSSWWVWNNRVLTAQDAKDLYADPWAMFDRGSGSASSGNLNLASQRQH